MKSNFSVYEVDASQIVGKATKILQPKNLDELKKYIKENDKICIRGGATGLAGGAVPQNESVLDLSLLDKIGNFDESRKTIEVEAGVILDDLNSLVSRHGLEFPVNPSSHAVCTLGGMIATNAVGSKAVKYGKTSEWINWVEVITPKGTLERKSKTELSDYAGMEGITGVIYKASIKLIEKPREISGELIASDLVDEVVQIVKKYRGNSNVSTIEFFDKKVSEMIGLSFRYHLFVEFESDEGSLKRNELKKVLEVRDKVYPMLAERNYTRIEDPKILIDKFPKLFNFLESYEIPVYGHLSVGLIHPCFKKEQEKLLPEVMALVKKLSGQISGEHGIGILKKDFVDINDVKLLKSIKKRLDPKNKFNGGKVI